MLRVIMVTVTRELYMLVGGQGIQQCIYEIYLGVLIYLL